MPGRKKTIAVFGTGKAQPGDEVFQLAYEVGKTLAEKGFVVANGGYAGTMLAAAKGAKEAGGEIVGVTCSVFGPGGANEYVTNEVVTESLNRRLEKLVELGDAYVVLAGGTGTLLELAYVWEFKNKGFLPADKPIIIVGRFWRPLMELMVGADPECAGCVEIAEGAEQMVEFLCGFVDES